MAAGAGGAWWFRFGAPTFAERPGVAVLPFANMGGDEATGRLADGLTEDTITDLARFRDLDVIARNSTEIYKGKPVDVRQVGQDLNVRYVLEGSIQRQGERVRVTAQLVDAGTGAHVWSERWDRPAEDVFAVQAEVAERVASSLGGYGLVAEAGRTAARRKPPANLTAYDHYLLGSEFKHRLTKEALGEAVRLLRRAVELDPQLARAWTTLTWAYAMSANWAADERELRQAALDAARRAVQLDPQDAEAHVALGEAIAMSGGGLGLAEVEFDKALQLNPNHVNVLQLYAAWASSFGKPGEGAEAAERLIRLNPNYPGQFANGVSYAFFMVGRYGDALRALVRRPEEVFTKQDYIVQAGSLAGLGRVEEAEAMAARALARYPDISVERWIGTPGFIEHERQRFAETMRAAGFPLCAKGEELADLDEPVRLPECEAERAEAASRS